MANYTIALYEILQEHMSDTQSIEDLDDILAVSKEQIFNGAPTSAMTGMTEAFKDPFILGFTMHFLFDEIGMETLTAFKLALASALLDNVEYINEIYSMLERQVWSEYEVRKIENKSTDKVSIVTDNDTTDTGTITDERLAENYTNTARNATTEDDGTIKDDGSITDGGTITDEGKTAYKGKTTSNNTRHFTAEDEQGNPTTPTIKQHSVESDGIGQPAYSESVQNGKVNTTNTQTGSITDTLTDTGSETVTERDGTGDLAYTKRTPTGTRTQTATHKGGMLHGYSDHASDSTHTNSLTPQSGVNASDIITISRQTGQPANFPNSVATPNQTATTKYLTNAEHVAQNDYLHSNWDIPYDTVNGDQQTNVESFQQFEDKQETHYNRETERTFDDREHETTRTFNNYEQEQETNYTNLTNRTTHHFNRDNLSETVYENNFAEHSDNEQSFDNRQDERDNTRTLDTERKTDSTRTLDTLRTEHDDTLTTDNINDTTTHTYDKAGTSDTTEIRDLAGTNDTDEQTYHFNYEMFFKAEPYLSKIWHLFDDCFMLVFKPLF